MTRNVQYASHRLLLKYQMTQSEAKGSGVLKMALE